MFDDNPKSTTSWVRIADFILLCLLTVWYLLWFIICPSRLYYYVKRFHLLYAFVIMIMWIPEGLNLVVSRLKASNTAYIIIPTIAFMRVTRVLTFIPLLAVWRPSRVLMRTIAGAWRDLVVVVVIISLLSSAFGSFTRAAEN